MRILYAEDDQFMQQIVVHSLIKMNNEITVVDDGLEAIQLLKEEEFHFIILDLFLPNAGGLDILKHYRENINKNIPVLILSRIESDDVISRAFELGATDYLTKPFAIDELLKKVKLLTGYLSD